MELIQIEFNKLLHDIAEKYKNNDAVVYCNNGLLTKLTYDESFQICQQLYKLLAKHTEANVCFGLLMTHNPYIPAIITCIQKLKCTYIFLDVNNPSINKLLQKLSIKYVLNYGCNKEQIKINNIKLVASLPMKDANIIHLHACEIEERNYQSFQNINFVVQTSGTTGTQKIIKVEHYSIISNVNCLRKIFRINQNDVIYYGTNLTFDPSVIELYLALSSGACLLMVSSTERENPSSLYKALFLSESLPKVTFVQMCPSAFLRWSQTEIEYILQSSLRILLLGGEQFPSSILTLKRSKNLEIFNVYGITEVSCWASLHKVNELKGDAPLGVALDDTFLEVRDENNRLISEGLGELFIGSNKRVCYVDNETEDIIQRPTFRATGDEVFVKGNELFYKGRINSVIKRFGFRINLDDIQNIVCDVTTLQNQCIWLKNKSKLLLYVKLEESDSLLQRKIIDKIRVKLLHCLPKEAFPDDIRVLSEFPVTKNGKINTKILEDMALISTHADTDLSVVFTSLLVKYLGLNETDLSTLKNGSFYDLGGNSISAAQFSSELRETMQTDYSTDLLDYLLRCSYDDARNFIESMSLSDRKRKIECDDNNITKRYKDEMIEVKWKYNLQACVDSSATILPNDLVAVGGFSNIFAILNCKNGNEISKVVLPGPVESECCVSPCGTFVCVGCYDGHMYCIRVRDASIVWKYLTNDKIKNKPCFVRQNSAIAFGSYDKFMHCVDFATGLKLWKTYLAEGITSNPVSVESKQCLFIATIHGSCFCIDENSGEIRWTFKIDSPIFGSPCLFESVIVWPSVRGSIHGVVCDTGKEVWNFQAQGHLYSSLISYKNFVIFGCHDKNVYCVEATQSEAILKFKVQLDSSISAGVCTISYESCDYILAASTSGCVYLIDFHNSCVISKLDLSSQIFSTPVTNCNRIFLGCRDNHFYCLGFNND